MSYDVYLAGPDVFLNNAIQHGEKLKSLCLKHGLIGHFPLDNKFDLSPNEKHSNAASIYSSNIFSIGELEKYLIHNPRKILLDIGYQLIDKEINHWQECDKKYTTKSKYNNSAFENINTKIEKVDTNV